MTFTAWDLVHCWKCIVCVVSDNDFWHSNIRHDSLQHYVHIDTVTSWLYNYHYYVIIMKALMILTFASKTAAYGCCANIIRLKWDMKWSLEQRHFELSSERDEQSCVPGVRWKCVPDTCDRHWKRTTPSVDFDRRVGSYNQRQKSQRHLTELPVPCLGRACNDMHAIACCGKQHRPRTTSVALHSIDAHGFYR